MSTTYHYRGARATANVCVLFISKPTKAIGRRLKIYQSTDAWLGTIARGAPKLKTTEEKLSKLVEWMEAPMPNALFFFSDPPPSDIASDTPSDTPDSATIPSKHTGDATKSIIYGCLSNHRHALCCLSGLFEKQSITVAIRSLVAQLVQILFGFGKEFVSHDYSDIKTHGGTIRSGVRFLRELMGLLNVMNVRLLVIIDDFNYLYDSQKDHENEVWEDLFKVLHCHKACDPNESKAQVKVFIRSSGSEDVLHKLGYSGVMVGAENSSRNCPYDDLVEVMGER